MTNGEEARLGYPLFPGDMGPWVRSAVVTERQENTRTLTKEIILIPEGIWDSSRFNVK